MDPWLTG
jgi:hypothetical protein